MAFAITQACCNDASCLSVCPVNCIHPTPDEPDFGTTDLLHIDPRACIDCGACADVCDTVMDKMGYARGLIKYSTQNGVDQNWTSRQILRHVARPRVLVYSAVLLAIVLGMGISLALRTPFKVDVVRDRGSLARIVSGGKIENVYRLQIMNATESAQHYRIGVSGLEGVTIGSENEFAVDATQSRWIAVRVQLPYEGAVPGSHGIVFDISALDQAQQVREKAVFLVPR